MLVAGLIVLALSFAVYLGYVYQYHLQIWDDSYITYRFAQHLASGDGLVWNIGGERVEGFTSLLHIMILALGIRLGINPEVGGLLIGVMSVVATIGILVAILRRHMGYFHPMAAVVLGLYLVDKTTAIHSTTGLETHLFVALLAGSYFVALSLLDAPTIRKAVLMAGLMFLSVLTRPEGVLYATAIYAVLFSFFIYRYYSSRNKEGLFVLASSVGVFVGSGLIYAVWKLMYFGYLLPNPFYVKSNDASLSGIPFVWPYVGHVFVWLGPIVLLSLAFSFFLLRKRFTGFPRDARTWAKVSLTLVPPLLALGYYLTIIHEVGGAFRFSFPTFFYFVLGGAVLVSLLFRNVSFEVRRFWPAFASVVVMLLVVQGLLIGLARNWPQPLEELATTRYHFLVTNALKASGVGDEGKIINNAAGVIPYFSNFQHIDPVGLADNFMSGRNAPTQLEKEAYLWSQEADVFIGFQPPAGEGASNPSEDTAMATDYVSKSILNRELEGISVRVFLKDPEPLHVRMRELRDNWTMVGELDVPGRREMRLRTYAYVRNDSPYFDKIYPELRKIVFIEAEDVDLNYTEEESRGLKTRQYSLQVIGKLKELARILIPLNLDGWR